MADAPQFLTLRRHRDLAGRERRQVVRWALLSLLGAFLLVGLANAFGQRPATQVVSSPEASLKVYSPVDLRAGLYYESRFTIDARREIENATLVLDPGWLEGITMNTLEPAPIGEASRDGRLVLELGRVPAGDTHLFFIHSQINPTNVGSRSQDVALYDGDALLLEIDRTVTIWP